DYVKVHLKGIEKATLSLISLKALEEKLPSKRFIRVHRSFIVALDKITTMTKSSLQIGKINIAVGDQYKEAFGHFLNKWI
ncbi:MAG: LytTR family DNA-binding domain-containing protein, partial [Mucilaginibacter sp.]